MPLCIGTSLAIIIPTSLRSFSAHRAKGAVDMSILKQWAVPVVVRCLGRAGRGEACTFLVKVAPGDRLRHIPASGLSALSHQRACLREIVP